jgi:hypothetical protein
LQVPLRVYTHMHYMNTCCKCISLSLSRLHTHTLPMHLRGHKA